MNSIQAGFKKFTLKFIKPTGTSRELLCAQEANMIGMKDNGLSNISQWASTLPIKMHERSGTRPLFTDNFPSSLKVPGGHLTYASESNQEPIKNFADLTLKEIS